jgi:hypothetical protein
LSAIDDSGDSKSAPGSTGTGTRSGGINTVAAPNDPEYTMPGGADYTERAPANPKTGDEKTPLNLAIIATSALIIILAGARRMLMR